MIHQKEMSANTISNIDAYCRQFIKSIISNHLAETLRNCHMAEGQIFSGECLKAQKEYNRIWDKYFDNCVNYQSKLWLAQKLN